MKSSFSPISRAIQWAILFTLALGLTFTACEAPTPVTLEQDAKMLADMTCQARQIREERFALANAIRYAEDEIREKKSVAAQQTLDSLMLLTEPIALRTKVMADSVKQALKQLQQAHYKTPEQRKALDVAMMRYLEQCSIRQD